MPSVWKDLMACLLLSIHAINMIFLCKDYMIWHMID